MNSTWLDKAVAWVDPQLGLRRLRHRAAVTVALSYEAAKDSRRTDGWVAGGGSANAEISGGRRRARERSRDLVRNNAWAANAKFQFSSKVAGTGITPRASTGNAARDKRVDALWREFDANGNADGPGTVCCMQFGWSGAMFESGDVFIRRRSRRTSDALKVPMQLQTLEADHLDTSRNFVDATGYTRDGIAFDRLGRRIGYWLWKQHPGESPVYGQNFVSQFVSADEVAHLYDGESGRPGQFSGMPRLCPVMRKVKDLDDLAEAKLYARKIEACFAVFVTQNNADSPLLGANSTDTAGRRIESLEPGMIEYLKSDEAVSFAEPKAAPGYTEETKLWLHEVAAGIQIPYELLTGDLSQTNYSSYRGSLLSFKDMIESTRYNCFIPRALMVIWRWFIDACFVAGLIQDQNYSVEWDAPKFDLLDRLEEAKADLAELRIGTLSWPQAVGRNGNDPDKQAAEIADWNKRLDAAGIILDSDPRLRTAQGNIPSGGTNAASAKPATSE
jgi:lambda family phage portal protein